MAELEHDITMHDLTRHPNKLIPHSRRWYDKFDNKCPVCGAPARFKLVIDGQEFKVSGRNDE